MSESMQVTPKQHSASFTFETEIGLSFEGENSESDIIVRVLSNAGEITGWGFSFDEILQSTFAEHDAAERRKIRRRVIKSLKRFLAELEKSKT